MGRQPEKALQHRYKSAAKLLDLEVPADTSQCHRFVVEMFPLVQNDFRKVACNENNFRRSLYSSIVFSVVWFPYKKYQQKEYCGHFYLSKPHTLNNENMGAT